MTSEHIEESAAGLPGTAAPSDAADAAAPVAVSAPPDAPATPEPPADDAFRFDLPAFEGPLDLLLHLIERTELDITEVSLLNVTEQYLAHLRSQDQINLGALAEFIAIGARLLLLKSRALLPQDEQPTVEEEDEGNDIRALVAALKEYRRFKQAAEFLRDRDGTSGAYRRVVPPPKVPMPTGLEAITLSSLVDVIREIMDRIPEEEPAGEVRREPVRLRDRMSRLVTRLDAERRTSFRRLIEGATTRTEVIVDFMAVLELIKQRYLEAVQSESFGDIDLVRLEGAIAPIFGAASGAEFDEDFTGV
ncbi:MAG: segregation/condensation protein A [Chloroflexi bacterium]|nr:MAG: segregation/condensation protein A [Chloroflexota bacterium]